MKPCSNKTSLFLKPHTLAAAVALALADSSALASTINVDVGFGGGYVEVDTTDGKCSLKEAILNANNDNQSGSPECASGSGADVIVLPTTGLGSTVFTLSSTAYAATQTGLPHITSDITIQTDGGLFGGVTIQRDTSSSGTPLRLFYVASGGKLTLDGLVLQYGMGLDAGGGAIRVDSGELKLINCTVSYNTTNSSGGAIDAYNATVSLSNTTLSYSTATLNGGGLVATNTSVTIDGSSIHHNQGDLGGGVEIHSGGTHQVKNSTITSNNSVYGGAGIDFTVPSGKSGQLDITDSNIFYNTATDSTAKGGGLNIQGVSAASVNTTISRSTIGANSANVVGGINVDHGNLEVHQSTIAGNVAGSNHTSAFFARYSNVALFNSTVSNNSAGNYSNTIEIFGPASPYAGFSAYNSTISNNQLGANGVNIFSDQKTQLALKNTIVANNAGNNCFINLLATTFWRDNWFDDSSCNGVTSPGSIRLGPLQNNGGSTLTHALLSGSAAIDKGDDAVCAMAGIGNVDQRGKTRVGQGAHCDIGAYEAREDTSFFVIPLKNGESVIFRL